MRPVEPHDNKTLIDSSGGSGYAKTNPTFTTTSLTSFLNHAGETTAVVLMCVNTSNGSLSAGCRPTGTTLGDSDPDGWWWGYASNHYMITCMFLDDTTNNQVDLVTSNNANNNWYILAELGGDGFVKIGLNGTNMYGPTSSFIPNQWRGEDATGRFGIDAGNVVGCVGMVRASTAIGSDGGARAWGSTYSQEDAFYAGQRWFVSPIDTLDRHEIYEANDTAKVPKHISKYSYVGYFLNGTYDGVKFSSTNTPLDIPDYSQDVYAKYEVQQKIGANAKVALVNTKWEGTNNSRKTYLSADISSPDTILTQRKNSRYSTLFPLNVYHNHTILYSHYDANHVWYIESSFDEDMSGKTALRNRGAAIKNKGATIKIR